MNVSYRSLSLCIIVSFALVAPYKSFCGSKKTHSKKNKSVKAVKDKLHNNQKTYNASLRRYNMGGYRSKRLLGTVENKQEWCEALRTVCLGSQHNNFEANLTYEFFEAYLLSSDLADVDICKKGMWNEILFVSPVARKGDTKTLQKVAGNPKHGRLRRATADYFYRAMSRAKDAKEKKATCAACEKEINSIFSKLSAQFGSHLPPAQMERPCTRWLLRLVRNGLIERQNETSAETKGHILCLFPPGRRKIEGELLTISDDHIYKHVQR